MAIVKIPGQLAPNGAFPIIDSNDIKGGFYIVDTLADRDAISPNNRKIGLPCYVIEQNMYYRLRDGIENENWDDWDLDNNGIIIKNEGVETKKDIILDIDHSHDSIHCTTLKDEYGNKYHTETNTDLVLTAHNNKTLTELLNYIVDKIEDTNDVPVEKVSLQDNFLIVKQGRTLQLKADVLPEDNTEKLVWMINDKTVATITQEGVLTTLKPGVTFIKVYSNKTRIFDTCSLIVSKEDVSDKEVTDGLICDLNLKSDKTNQLWKDATENYNHAEIIGSGTPIWETDCLYLDGTNYLKLPIETLQHDIATIEIVADLMFDKDDSKIVKLFCKKNSFTDMNYQINSESVSFGANGVVKTYEKLNCLTGLNVYTFVINKISKEILIYINGRLFDTITLKTEEEFGLSATSYLLIASNGKDLSPSAMKINRIKIFDKGLTTEEVLSEAEFLIGYYDGIENALNRYCCSLGRWSITYPSYSMEDESYRKSYRYTRVEPMKRFKITLINSNYSGSTAANGYSQDKNKHFDLSYLIYFNNGIAEFSVPSEIYFINFSFKNKNTNMNIYYTIEDITQEGEE